MRRRLVVSTIAIVLVVIGALAMPVGMIVYNSGESQLDDQVNERASAIAAILSDDAEAGRPPSLPVINDLIGPADGVRITTRDGEVILDIELRSDSRRETTAFAADGTRVVVATSADALDDNFRRQLQVMLVLALGAIFAAAGLAAVQAHQLARPLERLAKRATAIGEGDFSLGPFQRTHINEIDRIGTALETSAQRVHTMLANERHFTADATHQLRTGIAGLAMRAEILTMNPDEHVAGEAREILSQTDQLNATIDELLAAARNRTTAERGEFDLLQLVRAHIEEWQPRYDAARRHIDVVAASAPTPVYGTKGLAGQVLDILIDNALRHGAGTVTCLIEGPSVTVIDQGAGVDPERLSSLFDGPVDPSARHGRGLPLARRLAQVDGATLEAVGNRPLRIRFTLPRSLIV